MKQKLKCFFGSHTFDIDDDSPNSFFTLAKQDFDKVRTCNFCKIKQKLIPIDFYVGDNGKAVWCTYAWRKIDA